MIQNLKHRVWTEKYRPQQIDDFLLDDRLKEIIQRQIEKQDVDNFIFYGSQGVGKTSIVEYIKKNLPCETLVVNGSVDNKIDFVRDEIIPFMNKGTFQKFKIVDIREFDRLTSDAQKSLKDEIESRSDNCRFLITTNEFQKINPAIASRFTAVHVHPSDVMDVALRIKDILDKEGIEIPEDQKEELWKFIKSKYPDVRNIIQNVQSFSSDGKLKFTGSVESMDTMDSILQGISMCNKKNYIQVFRTIVEFIENLSDTYITRFYRHATDNMDLMGLSEEKQFECIIILNEYDFRNTTALDSKVNIMACVKKLIDLKNE